MAEPLVVLSTELGVQTGNRAFYAAFGVSRDKAQGLPLTEFGNKALASLRERLEQMLTDGRAFETFEVEHVVPGTGPRTFCLDAHPFSSPRQSVPMILLAFHDITARKQAEAAGAYLASIVGSCDDAIIGKSPEGVIQTWNGAAERLYGYRAEEVVGHSMRELLPADRQQEETDILERMRAGRTVVHFETVRLRKDGNRVDVSLTLSPIRDKDGKIVGISHVARDITDAYVHAGGQWEWDSAAPAGVVQAAGMHASRIDGAPLIYNRRDPYLPDLLMCRAELADVLLDGILSAYRDR